MPYLPLPASSVLQRIFRQRQRSQAGRLHPVPPELSKEEVLERSRAASEYAAEVIKDFEGIERLPEAIREANEVRRQHTARLAKKK